MTPDELRARCEQVLEHLEKVAAVRYYSIDPTVELGENAYLLVESLCREMIAEGIKIVCQVIQTEFTLTLAECEKEAEMLKDGAELKKPNG